MCLQFHGLAHGHRGGVIILPIMAFVDYTIILGAAIEQVLDQVSLLLTSIKQITHPCIDSLLNQKVWIVYSWLPGLPLVSLIVLSSLLSRHLSSKSQAYGPGSFFMFNPTLS